MTLSEALEMYVKVIYKFELERGGKGVTTVTEIADAMKVKPPSVTDALQRLDKLGMVKYEKYHGARLTAKGKRKAKELISRYETLKEFLILVGVSESAAAADACEIEHVTHKETIRKITEFVHFIHNDPQSIECLKRFQKMMRE